MIKSIRVKILVSVVVINLLGAVAIVVYLHQSYSTELDTSVANTVTHSVAAWDHVKGLEVSLDPIAQPGRALEILKSMKAITGADYGLMITKDSTDETAYLAARESVGLPNNWSERDTYGMLVATDAGTSDMMLFEVPAIDVPETGKRVGVENGACSQMCHEGITGSGPYWTVRWSGDSGSRGHSVFPVLGADGEPVGVVYSIDDISRQAEAAKDSMLRTLLVVGLTLLVSTLVIGALIDTWIFRRLVTMTRSMEDISMRIAGGDFEATYETDGTMDEIGAFEQFFADFVNVISATLRSLVGKK